MNKKQIRLTESDLKQIVKESVNRIVKESNELDANGWKDYIMRNSSYPRDIKDIENKASWEAFDDDVNSLYGQRGCYADDYASQAYADDPLSDFYGLENKNTYDLKGYLAKKKLNKLAKNESKDMNKKLIRLTESDLHKIVKESVNKILKEDEIPSVSYQSKFGDMGTHYNQTIKIGLTQEDLDTLNSKLVGMADSYDTPDENGVISSNPMLNGHEMVSNNLRTPLQFGKNHLKLSQLYALAELLNWKEYKRVKMDRNTILLIVQI